MDSLVFQNTVWKSVSMGTPQVFGRRDDLNSPEKQDTELVIIFFECVCVCVLGNWKRCVWACVCGLV